MTPDDSSRPVFYGTLVLDLKIIKWETIRNDTAPGALIPFRGAAEDRLRNYGTHFC